LLQNLASCDEQTQALAEEISKINSTIPLRKYAEYDEVKLGSLPYDFNCIKDKKGFISKIIESFIRAYHSTDLSINMSNLRYWQASSIESFVRGCNPFFQLFVARSGIFKVLIEDILNIGMQDNANLQTAFDILGETLKFNKRTILILESQIPSASLSNFTQKCLSHLVDSNVFIRSLLLTLYKHTESNSNADPNRDNLFDCGFLANSELCKFVNKNIDKILNGILSVINSYNISQTNLS